VKENEGVLNVIPLEKSVTKQKSEGKREWKAIAQANGF
jgi:hypothetical protein